MVQHSTLDHSGLTGVISSYGSNANSVAAISAGGASTSASRADHVHVGVTSLTHTSNTMSGPITLVAQGSIGITKTNDTTIAINSVAGSGGSGSSIPDLAGANAYNNGPYNTTSGTAVDVDATNLSITITTGARRVLVGATSHYSLNAVTGNGYLILDIDGVDQNGGPFGFMPVASKPFSWAGTWLTDVLSAGSHTFKLQFAVDGGLTLTLSNVNFWVAEQLISA